jgi:serine/threonine protein kinase
MIQFIQQHLEDYNEKFIKNIMFQTLQSLNELHKAGFVHRDIKPENILFNSHLKDFSIFLTDFGLSI